MRKNKKWEYETKVSICERLISGESYQSIAKEYGINNTGMLANWKKSYIAGTLNKEDKRGRKKQEVSDLEILKKCYAQLMKIRSK